MTELIPARKMCHLFSGPGAIEQFDHEFWVSTVGEIILPIQPTFATREIDDEFSLFLEKSIKLEYLNSLYTLKNPGKIKRFLVDYDYLIDQLLEVRGQIEKLFSENLVEIRLEYHKDPEESYEGLFLIVRTIATPELSLDLLEKFEDEWWLDLDAKIRNQLTVTVRTT